MTWRAGAADDRATYEHARQDASHVRARLRRLPLLPLRRRGGAPSLSRCAGRPLPGASLRRRRGDPLPAERAVHGRNLHAGGRVVVRSASSPFARALFPARSCWAQLCAGRRLVLGAGHTWFDSSAISLLTLESARGCAKLSWSGGPGAQSGSRRDERGAAARAQVSGRVVGGRMGRTWCVDRMYFAREDSSVSLAGPC